MIPMDTDISIVETSSETQFFPYRSPAKFGGRVVRDVTLLDVTVRVRNRNGREAVGWGSMSMGNIWAWPSQTLSTDDTLRLMVEFGRKVAEAGNRPDEFGHPLELTWRIGKEYPTLAKQITDRSQTEPMARLAQLVAASPFEAAVFDAYGRLYENNSYRLLSKEFCNEDLSYFLDENFKGEYLDRYVLDKPKDRMPLYHLVGALDPLDADDVDKPLQDGLPEHLADWIDYNGLTHLKIKLNGDDLDWDVRRVLRVDRIATKVQSARKVDRWYYSADFNERCENIGYVMEFLARIREHSPAAYDRLQYIEQPTDRDLRRFPENKVHDAAKLKPVVIDEALIDYDSLLYSRELGYSGVALKACKGHSEALLMGAAAQKFGMFLCVQDLTCPGASFLHSATLSARIPGVHAIEGNGRQYCPAANWCGKPLYPGMFDVRDGMLQTSVLDEPGLGFHWPDMKKKRILSAAGTTRLY